MASYCRHDKRHLPRHHSHIYCGRHSSVSSQSVSGICDERPTATAFCRSRLGERCRASGDSHNSCGNRDEGWETARLCLGPDMPRAMRPGHYTGISRRVCFRTCHAGCHLRRVTHRSDPRVLITHTPLCVPVCRAMAEAFDRAHCPPLAAGHRKFPISCAGSGV